MIRSFASLFVIMNPFASIPIFLGVTKDSRYKSKAATQAISVAAGVLFSFLFFGRFILMAFGITLHSLKVGGGIILGILGIQLVLGRSIFEKERKYTPALTLIGTPMLTGPGVITMSMILVETYGHLITALASIVSLTLSWIILRTSEYIYKFAGENAVDIVSRVMGLLLTATATELVISGFQSILGAP